MNGSAPVGWFYGWRIVAVAAFGLMLSWPLFGIYLFGAFVRPLSAEFGWQRGEASVAVGIVSWTAMLMTLLIGPAVDRYGVRRILIPSIVLLGATAAAMSRLSGSLTQFYGAYVLIAVFGAGTSVLVYSKLVVNWFDRRRGLALGLSIAGAGLGVALVPPAATALIATYGWRTAYLVLGLFAAVVVAAATYAVVREHPAELGLRKDGAHAAQGSALTTQALGHSVRTALAMPEFKYMLLSFFIVGGCAHGAIAHLVPLLQDRGVSAQDAASVLTVVGLAQIAGRVLAGYLMDRYFAPHVALGFAIGPVFGFAALALGATGATAWVAALLLGLIIGAEFDVIGYFTSRYGGLQHFGALYSFNLASFQFGGGVASVLMGYSHDWTGDYTLAMWVLSGLLAIVCGLYTRFGPYPDFAAHAGGPATRR